MSECQIDATSTPVDQLGSLYIFCEPIGYKLIPDSRACPYGLQVSTLLICSLDSISLTHCGRTPLTRMMFEMFKETCN